MKLPNLPKPVTYRAPLNVFTLLSVSTLWGVMLNLISPGWIGATIILALIGYGSEIKSGNT